MENCVIYIKLFILAVASLITGVSTIRTFSPLAPGSHKAPEALRNSRTIRRPHP